jgi:hypothetical protein
MSARWLGRGVRYSTWDAAQVVTYGRSRVAVFSPWESTCPGRAVTLARSRGALALRLSVFDDVPGAGSWRTALLLDGNIGIGASPATLLRRIASLLAPGGEVLVELAPPGGGVAIRRIRLEHGSARSAWFQWAIVAVDAIDEPARRAGLEVVERWLDGERFFALLRLA